MVSPPLNILTNNSTSSSTSNSISTPIPAPISNFTFTSTPTYFRQSDDCLSSSIFPVPLSSPVVEWRSEDGCDNREDHNHMLSISLSLLQQLNECKESNPKLDPKITQYVSTLFLSSNPSEIHEIQQILITYIRTNPIGYLIIPPHHF